MAGWGDSMSERAFSLTAAIIFLLIGLGNLLRFIFAVPVVVQGIPIPVWASLIAFVVMGFLAHEGFYSRENRGRSRE